MKRVFHLSILLTLPLVFLELGSLGFFALSEGKFVNPEYYFAKLNEDGYRHFIEQSYAPDTGWDLKPSTTRTSKGCRDQDWTFTTDKRGARIYQPHASASVKILIVGDSYTFGDEASDSKTYPAQLEELLGVPIVNHGVSGFGPTQFYVKLEQIINSYPNARVVLFGVMVENIRRVVNSFRPAISTRTGILYGFKPYLESGQIMENPNRPPAPSLDEFKKLARKAFREDYWHRPQLRFPVTVSLVKYLASNKIRFDLASNSLKAHWQDKYLFDNFTTLLNKLLALTGKRKIKPVLIMIPQDGSSRRVVADAVSTLRRMFAGRGLTVVDVGASDVDWDWDKYRTRNCHPSPYGYGVIARVVADEIGPILQAP